jgi:2-polyprenyl-3-methyl-5-hydroxy-6-metoxy-1,4-benzoquinol methylase
MAEFDKYADQYEEIFSKSVSESISEQAYFIDYKIQHVAYRLRDKKISTILDFGCGIGLSLSSIRKYFPDSDVWGYDVSEKSVAIAKNKSGLENIFSDVQKLPKNNFDILFIANVFHHIPPSHRSDVMQLCKDLIHPGGSIFIFEHNPFNPLTRHVFNHCDLDRDAIMLRKSEVITLARLHHLTLSHAAYTLFFPGFVSVLRPLEKYMGWLPLGAQYCVELRHGSLHDHAS